MEVAVCFLILSIFAANNVRGEDGCKQIDFLPCETDKHLQGHVIKKIVMRVDDATLQNCKHQCYVERHCVSYNLAPIQGDKRVCELQDTDHVGDPNDVKSLTGAEYCPVKNPCASSPCHSYQICRPDFYLGTFKCFNNTCAGLKNSGKGTQNGVYTITPVPGFNLQVYCDEETDGGGWTVIQKRFDGSVDFYRGWDDYKRGFGNKNAEYWLGLDVIHNLTNITRNELRVDLKDVEGTGAHAMYGEFRVESESQKYRLFLGNFKGGDAGDSFSYHNSMFFTTFDSDNDDASTINCAVKFKGAWWYHTCHTSNLNGRYLNGTHGSRADGINWKTWKGFNYSAKKVEMKIRPMGFGSK